LLRCRCVGLLGVLRERNALRLLVMPTEMDASRLSLNRTAIAIAALMLAASLGSIVARPGKKLAEERPPIVLESAVPKSFGDWTVAPQDRVLIVNPQTQALLDRIYSQILSRIYVDRSGYQIMLSIAYGGDQRRSLQAHMPEVCYPAQGFDVKSNDPGRVSTNFGVIPVRRLYTVRGLRREPVTYWFTVGDRAVEGTTQKRLIDLRYGLTGRIPDGMVVRISSIDRDALHAYRLHDAFIAALLKSLSATARKRMGGWESG
jgi:EpsI family protein